MRMCESVESKGASRVDRKRRPGIFKRLNVRRTIGFSPRLHGVRPSAYSDFVGTQAFGAAQARLVPLRRVDLRRNGDDDRLRQFLLHRENVFQHAVVFFGPDMITT